MAISIILDPTEVAGGRVQLDISRWIGQDVDWGDASIEAYMANAAMGEVPVDFRVPNRTVVLPLLLMTRGGTSFTTIRTQLQSKVAILQREGGWFKRTTSLGNIYADVVGATLEYGGVGWQEILRNADLAATLTLECLPDWYGAEIDLGSTSENTLPEYKRVLTGIKGNYPARTRIVVSDTEGQNQRGVIWGMRSENYSNASTNALAYECELLTPLDVAATASQAGASGGGSNVILHTSLAPNSWTPVPSTTIASGGTDLTHKGVYNVWVRARQTSAGLNRLRLLWDVGDLTNPEENTAVTMPGLNGFYLMNLGQVRITAAPIGTHRWRGIIQAYTTSTSGTGNIYLDRLFLVPADDGAGTLYAEKDSTVAMSGYSARDTFNQSVGALSGKVLPHGGTWTGVVGTTDFSISANATATRDAFSEAAWAGRLVSADVTSLTGCSVGCWISSSPSTSGFVAHGVAARIVNSNNFLLGVNYHASASTYVQAVYKKVGGTVSLVGEGPDVGGEGRIRLDVSPTGAWAISMNDTLMASGWDADLAPGGALASGSVGLFDCNTGGDTAFRTFDDFWAGPSATGAVVYANQSCEIRHDVAIREDSGGTGWGPVAYTTGALPRLPPSGLENYSVELFVKASRGELGTLPDSGIDNVSVQTLYRPTWLFVPEA